MNTIYYFIVKALPDKEKFWVSSYDGKKHYDDMTSEGRKIYSEVKVLYEKNKDYKKANKYFCGVCGTEIDDYKTYCSQKCKEIWAKLCEEDSGGKQRLANQMRAEAKTESDMHENI